MIKVIQIILYINFCCKGAKPLEEKIESLFASAKIPIKIESQPAPTTTNNNITTNNDGNTEERLPHHDDDHTINNVGIINKIDNSENKNKNLNLDEEEETPNINIVRKNKKFNSPSINIINK